MATGIVNTLESTPWLDRVADPIQKPIGNWLDRAPAVRDALNGKWLGHSLHAALTDIPVGAWSAGMVLDALSTTSRRRRALRQGADTVHTVGLVAALAAAVTGVADWSRYGRASGKRVGAVHGMANVVIAGLFGGSLLARSKGARDTGIALAGAGFGLLIVSGWLGRELTYKLGLNVASWDSKTDRPQPATGSLETHASP